MKSFTDYLAAIGIILPVSLFIFVLVSLMSGPNSYPLSFYIYEITTFFCFVSLISSFGGLFFNLSMSSFLFFIALVVFAVKIPWDYYEANLSHTETVMWHEMHALNLFGEAWSSDRFYTLSFWGAFFVAYVLVFSFEFGRSLKMGFLRYCLTVLMFPIIFPAALIGLYSNRED